MAKGILRGGEKGFKGELLDQGPSSGERVRGPHNKGYLRD